MPTDPGDAELVEEARAGRPGAFDQLVDRYWRSAIALARTRTRQQSDAEDAAQEAFVLAFRKLGTLRDPARFGGWLLTIVVRSCIEVGRRHARRPVLSEDVELLEPRVPHPPLGEGLPGVDDPALREAVHDAIQGLPDRYRPVVVLRYAGGMDVKSIARSLSIPLGTVVSQLYRAHRILRPRLQHLVSER